MQPVLVNPPRRFGHAELAVSGLALPPNVIRMPRGPDKGKGFQRWCNSRMKPGSPSAPAAPSAAPAGAGQQKQQQPLPQRKSRAIPIVAPPEVLVQLVADAAPEPAAEGAAAAPAPANLAVPAAPAPPPAVNNNLVVNLDSSDSDEGHYSDHEQDLYPEHGPQENERTR